MLDIAIDEDLETIFTAVLLNSDEDAVGKMLVHPAASVAAVRCRRAFDVFL